MTTNKSKISRFNRWGYFFLIPFAAAFIIFQLIPLGSTIYYSFFEKYKVGLTMVGPKFVGLKNYQTILTDGTLFTCLKNTMIMWIMGFIPQIVVSLLLAAWFSDPSLRLKGSVFFKAVIYLPNLIMAASFAMLFYALFSTIGPVNSILMDLGIIERGQPINFLSSATGTRCIVALMNLLMWFGNTTILLLAGMLGIDTSLYEAAEVDGATSTEIFFKITLPLVRPILVFVMITSLIGGMQMFDVPQILTNGTGGGNYAGRTLIMYLNDNLFSKNYGKGGAISVFLFLVTAVLSLIVFKFNTADSKEKR